VLGAGLRAAATRLDAGSNDSSDHVLAARAHRRSSSSSIVFRHMVPNALGPVIVQATIVLATSIIDAAALSFLGLGKSRTTANRNGARCSGQAQTVHL
jgi:peptide/nickel transport system permease protein